MIDLVNVSAHWDITSFFTLEIGAFVGFWGEIGCSWNYSLLTIEAVFGYKRAFILAFMESRDKYESSQNNY